ncbi:uncharacterized protein LOC108813859 [Raphanus sativus]|uniref:Uncharacterized protein LOC108813859 n=1 Tax=Raphanus sativus TaxID=3726 RepID=A0A6J0K303_RAPSA|nr:uncharacterized protein LOC108813859 [Raphanus sativus]
MSKNSLQEEVEKMTTLTYNTLCIGFMFVQCFSTVFARDLQDNLDATQITPKHVETAQLTNFGAKHIPSNIGFGAVGSLEVAITFSIPIIQIPFPKEGSTVGIINEHDKDKIKGIVITPATTHEFGLSPGKDGVEF